MKITLIFLSALLTTPMLSFTFNNEMPECYFSFKSATNLTAAAPDRLPESSRTGRAVKTENGEVEISRTDGYRVLYNNDKNVPFVNLKVELSESAYSDDKKNLIANLRYLNSHSTNMESKDLIELELNGFKIYGLSRGSIEAGSNLGTFVMFPGDDIVVYFYFNNLKPEFRNFDSLEDYIKQRNRFMEEYTKHLKVCKR